MTVKRISHIIQLGASLSGTQKGGCFPSIIPNSIDELSETSGDGSRSLPDSSFVLGAAVTVVALGSSVLVTPGKQNSVILLSIS